MKPFQQGLSVVRKGRSWGIIDAKGNFLVPYGKYKSISDEGFINGYCAVSADVDKTGYIDRSGKLVIPCEYSLCEPFDDQGYAYVETKSYRGDSYMIKANGEKIKLPPDVKPGIQQHGIYDRSGKLIEKVDNVTIGKLSDGLIRVQRIVEHGEFKYGYLDRNGKVVIPFQFSYQPGDFSDGLAIVYPKDNTNFDYAYIDKTGKVVLEIKKGSLQQFSGSRESRYYNFSNGVALSRYNVNGNQATLLFKDGSVKGFNDILKHPKAATATFASMENGYILFIIANSLGLADKNGTVIIEPKFRSLTFFDPVSNLAQASYESSGVSVTGFVDIKGTFVIVKGSSSTF
ncbi:WG repeat-containing protein [Chryseolinea sp. T2]|uniref:WG repeat-containing protein n=1 Tax=Chryseolinea sp. T2 TaxID=3129255 RepID=UPI003077B285